MLSWNLFDLLSKWTTEQHIYEDVVVTGLSLDSRTTSSGDLFLATKGLQSHGVHFAGQAISKGAVAIAWEPTSNIDQKSVDFGVPCIRVENLHNQLGFIGKRFFSNPSENINLTAITGTDGKTSVSHFVAQSMEQLEIPCGVVGTLGYGVFPNLNSATHTTPDAIKIHELFYDFVENNISHAVIEASSHGLKQGRLKHVDVDTAVFTNLGRDHMDYHDSLEDYGNAKRILFEMSSLKNAIVTIDGEFGNNLANDISQKLNLITCSRNDKKIENTDFLIAKNIIASNGTMEFTVDSSWGEASIQSNLIGMFNVDNLLSTLGVLLANKIPFEEACSIVSKLKTVDGRMDLVSSNKQGPTVVVDYAHTPQALANVLQTLSTQSPNKLWCVFGCGGDRDKGKRAEMARAVEQFSDYAIITDDNPRTENPGDIVEQISKGFAEKTIYKVIHNRKQAIQYAIENADKADTVLIAGKGHETVQIINNERIPFDDKKVAMNFLRMRNS